MIARRHRCHVWLTLVSALLLFSIPSAAQPPQTSPTPGLPTPTQPTPGTPRRDPIIPQAEPGTGSIRGRIVALDTGTPVRHVTVRVMGGNVRNGRSALTDAQGQFEIKELPAGRYMLVAMKGGFVTLQYGQRGPTDSGKQIDLANGQALTNITMALPRGAVITGRVLDENGDPVAEMPVSALQFRMFNGRRRLIPTGRTAMTNDIGVYRLYGLAPGEYYVSVGGRGAGMPFGDMTSGDDSSGYGQTFYPGTSNLAEAQRISVGVGQEVNADLPMTPMKLVRVSGTVVDSSGKPASSGFLTLQNRGAESGVMVGGGGTTVRPDGTFQIVGVAPGTYRLIAQSNPMMRGPAGVGPGNDAADSREMALVPVTVANTDITDLRVRTSKGLSISGRVTYEGGTPPQAGGTTAPVRVMCMPVDEEGLAMSMTPGQVKDQQFEVKGVMSPCLLRAMPGQAGWRMKSVALNGADITDRPITPEGKPITGVEVVLSNRLTSLTGTVTDDHGQPSKDYVVLAWIDDKDKWQPTINQRYIRRARPDQNGTFKIEDLPPGTYRVAAFDSLDQGEELDPEFLEKAESLGKKAQLSEGGTQTVSLKITIPVHPAGAQ